jgi:AraC-like DNA-binding protein
MSVETVKPPLEGAIVQSVVLVDKLTFNRLGSFRTASLPGHLLNIVLAGEVKEEVGGRVLRAERGDGLWYHENEEVHGTILKVPFTFYTVNFIAPRLAPPSPEDRLWHVTPRTYDLLDSLLDAWNDLDRPSAVRHLETFSRLLRLLAELLPASSQHHSMERATQLWWDIEKRLREDVGQPLNMSVLEKLCGRSQRSVVRACQLAVGTSPMKRIKELRLSYARGLVLHSRLSITEIAMRVGYSRVQELSRDYHRRFNVAPGEDRRVGPDYRSPHIHGDPP